MFAPSLHSHTLSFSNITNFGIYINQAVLTSSNVTFGRVTLGSYYLDALTANNKVSDSDKWDGYHFSDYINQIVKTTSSPIFNGITIDGDIIGLVSGKIKFSYGQDWYIFYDSGINGLKMGLSGHEIQFLYDNGNYRTIFSGGITVSQDIAISDMSIQFRTIADNTHKIFYANPPDALMIQSYNQILFNFVNGFGYINSGNGAFKNYYLSGDYGLTWTQTMPTGVNGLCVIVYNSNAGVLASRTYYYSNSGWHYIALI
jgi:hypothetical protein